MDVTLAASFWDFPMATGRMPPGIGSPRVRQRRIWGHDTPDRSSGVTLIIGDGVRPFRDGYDFVDFRVSIVAAGLRRMPSFDQPRVQATSLHRYLRELADDWKGTQADPSWEAIELGLSIDAHREPLGHVLLTFSLRELRSDAWLVRVTVQLDAGEEMATLAREVERLLGG